MDAFTTHTGRMVPLRRTRPSTPLASRLPYGGSGLDLMASGEVLDLCLWTAPAKFGTGAASTWLVGSADDVVATLQDYVALGVFSVSR